MKHLAYMGIDPGANGAACLVSLREQAIAFIQLKEGPSMVMDWITHINRDYDLAPIYLEEVHSLHRMSAKSNFSFGYNVGEIQTVLKIAKVSWDLVQPKEWQKGVGITIPPKTLPAHRKRIIAERVKQLYPKADIYGPKGGLLDGKSDALMIAHFCLLRYRP